MQTLWHRGRAMDFLNQPMFKVENDMHPSIFTLEGTCLLQLQLISFEMPLHLNVDSSGSCTHGSSGPP